LAVRSNEVNKKGAELAGPRQAVGRLLSSLEVNPQTDFHLTRGVNRAGDPAKTCRTGKTQAARITRRVVVEDVGELRRERGPDAFCELEVLGDRRVHIPPIQAS